MKFKELVRESRSYRRFKQTPIPENTLRELVDLARIAPTGANQQPLKFLLSCDSVTNAKIFPCTAWAAALKGWPGPAEDERPTAYVVILLDRDIAKGSGQNAGIAAQTMALAAAEQGIGACMIGSINRSRLRENLELPEKYQIELILALGIPGETVVLEDVPPQASLDYYRDENDVHHVPKRTLDEVIV